MNASNNDRIDLIVSSGHYRIVAENPIHTE